MPLKLFEHPFSSFCQKALMAFYENDIPFEAMILEPGGAASAELERLWPLNKFPVLKDGDRVIPEATMIIEYLEAKYPGPVALIPKDLGAAIEVRLMDRYFDNYVSTPQSNIVVESLRPADSRDPYGVTTQRALLDRAYVWLDTLMATRRWAAGERFSMADCAAALPFSTQIGPTRSRRPCKAFTPTVQGYCSARPMRARSTKPVPIETTSRLGRRRAATEVSPTSRGPGGCGFVMGAAAVERASFGESVL